MNGELVHPHARLLTFAGVLGLAGLATAVLYMLHSTPYTMVAFLAGGVLLIAIAVLIFAFVIVSDLRARLASLSVRSFQPGEVIFAQGDAPEFMYVVSEGSVEFVVEDDEGESQVGRLGPADYFGDLAILNGTPYPVTARAATEVKLIPIHRRDFRSLYSQLPKLREDVHEDQQRRREILEAARKQSGTKRPDPA